MCSSFFCALYALVFNTVYCRFLSCHCASLWHREFMLGLELCKMTLMLNYFDVDMNHEGLLLDKVANDLSSN